MGSQVLVQVELRCHSISIFLPEVDGGASSLGLHVASATGFREFGAGFFPSSRDVNWVVNRQQLGQRGNLPNGDIAWS